MYSQKIRPNQSASGQRNVTHAKLRQRKSTRSVSKEMIRSNKSQVRNSEEDYKFKFDPQQEQAEKVKPPSPVQSSQQGQSIQVKYLSYLAKVIDSAPQNQDSNQIQEHYHKAQFWQTVYESAIYVKKGHYRTQIDDNLIMEEFAPYFGHGKIHPEAETRIGQELLTNGYVMSAYAIGVARKRKSPFIFKYLMQYFLNEHQILTNLEEFMYIFQNYVHQDKVREIIEAENGQNFRNNGYNLRNLNQNLTPGEYGVIRRSTLQTSYQNSQSNQSHTVILEDSDII